MSIIDERYELAKERIFELQREADGEFSDYIKNTAALFQTVTEVFEADGTEVCSEEWNKRLYADIAGEAYEQWVPIYAGIMRSSAIPLCLPMKRKKRK